MSGNADNERGHTANSPSQDAHEEPTVPTRSVSHTYPSDDLQPAVRRREKSTERRYPEPKPLKPQPINAENALFVLLGVAFVVGLLVAAVLGL